MVMPYRPCRRAGRPSPRLRLNRWQVSRSWARLIREAEGLWRVDVRALHRLAAQELGQLHEEVPGLLRGRVNRWLVGFRVRTRLVPSPAKSRLGRPAEEDITAERAQAGPSRGRLNRSGGI